MFLNLNTFLREKEEERRDHYFTEVPIGKNATNNLSNKML